MKIVRSGESRRFEIPAWFDRRIAVVIGVVIAAGMAGHLLFQAFAPGKAGAAQSHPSSLAVDTQPAVYLTPLTPHSRPVIIPAMKPDIDIQPHIARQHRKHHQERPKPQPAEVKPPEPAKEDETQSTERIDNEEGTTFIPKRSKDEDRPGNSGNNNFNGLGD